MNFLQANFTVICCVLSVLKRRIPVQYQYPNHTFYFQSRQMVSSDEFGSGNKKVPMPINPLWRVGAARWRDYRAWISVAPSQKSSHASSSDRSDSIHCSPIGIGHVELIFLTVDVNICRCRTSWQQALCGRWNDWCAATYSDDNPALNCCSRFVCKCNLWNSNCRCRSSAATYSEDNPALNCCSRFVCKCNLWNSNCRCRSRLFSRRWSGKWRSSCWPALPAEQWTNTRPICRLLSL